MFRDLDKQLTKHLWLPVHEEVEHHRMRYQFKQLYIRIKYCGCKFSR
ncbi:hypothetical protein J2T17_004416 [Paenibacillus mucilaginosus]